MIDSHCHLDGIAFDADRESVLARARAAGVEALVVPGVAPGGWARAARFAQEHPGVHVAFGIHPQLLPEVPAREDDRMLADLEAALARGGAVAVGECGLDGADAVGAALERQVSVLRGQLALARRFRLPVILHLLRAHHALLAVLREEPPLPAGGVLHSYSAGAEMVPPFAALGLHFGFGGPLTYEGARKPIAALRAVPPGRLLLETDAPDQTPRPHRGRGEPAFLAEVLRAAAAALGRTEAEVEAATSAAARGLFRLG
ncbi:TatD family hydrolase [Anaeromyxobacter paludicola]|uniref:TatD family hydrolase n=1 Tax=Anaeromyxobacter paludicola TaxID=2918171 RepID=A0ABN6N9C5_9BACT|nr:TatD family hydrolase [Anaeromyxobacter paludicola]BDG08503.1 TatD family hydrolase [Anaeromyxobacter paludicola]